MSRDKRKVVQGAMAFIFLMGIVSLFSDMTHEGARSILGEYLDLTGASAATIGFTKSFEPMCKKVCTEEEYLQMKKAFFEKEQNLRRVK